MTAVDGSSATGTASVLPDGRPAVSIQAKDLQPTDAGENYIIWFYDNDDRAFPVGRQTVGDDGALEGEVPVPRALLPYVSRFDKVRIGRATNAEAQAALRGAAGARSLPPFVGVTVLEGDNPRG